MVGRVLAAVYKEVRGLHRAAYVLALFTLGSQVLALIRDRLLAHQFGAGVELDLYYAAFRIPDLLYVLFASTLSVYVLIPFVAERMEKSKEHAQALLSQVFTLFVFFYIGLALVIGLLAPYIVDYVFPGFDTYKTELVLLIRVLLLQPLFLGVSSLFGVITQLHHRFVLYAVSPLIYNAGIIAGLLFFYPYFGLLGLVFGVVLGALGHVLIQVPFILKSGLAPYLAFKVEFPFVFAIFRTSLPRALTLSLHQIVLLGLVGFATLMQEGSVAVFQFAFNLQSVPLAIIGVSYSVAAFPMLAKLHAEGKLEEFRIHIMTALRHVIFWSVPVLALIIVARAQFVRVVLGTGAFNWDDTRLTAAVLALFAIALLSQAINLLLVRALYAAGNTRIPLYVTLVSSIGILVFAYVSLRAFETYPMFRNTIEVLFRVEGVPGTEVLMLALGYTIALTLHSLVLLVLSRKVLRLSRGILRLHILKAVTAACVAGIVAYATLNFFVEGLRTETLIGIFLQGLLAVSLGLLGAWLAYYLLKSQELKEVYLVLQRRFLKREDVALPQDEDTMAV
jgi:putative peptidoglycan lipid II flippase